MDLKYKILKGASFLFAILMGLLIYKQALTMEDMFLILAVHGLAIVVAMLAEVKANFIPLRKHFIAFSTTSNASLIYRTRYLFLDRYYLVFPFLFVFAYSINPNLAVGQKLLYTGWTFFHAVFLVLFILVLYDYLLKKRVGKHMPTFISFYMMYFILIFNFSATQYTFFSPWHVGVAFVSLLPIESISMLMLVSLAVFATLCLFLLFLNKKINEFTI